MSGWGGGRAGAGRPKKSEQEARREVREARLRGPGQLTLFQAFNRENSSTVGTAEGSAEGSAEGPVNEETRRTCQNQQQLDQRASDERQQNAQNQEAQEAALRRLTAAADGGDDPDSKELLKLEHD